MNKMYSLKYLILVPLIVSVHALRDVNLNNLNLKSLSSLLKILSRYGNHVKYVQIQPNKGLQKINYINENENPEDYRYDNGIMDVYPNERFLVKPSKHTRILIKSNDEPETHTRILIKRLIPHGLPPSKLEYDSKFKTYYRPLVRIHKRKPLLRVETMLNIDGSRNSVDKYGNDIYDYYDNDDSVINFVLQKGLNEKLKHFKIKEITGNSYNNRELLQPFTINWMENYRTADENNKRFKIFNKINKLLDQTHSSSHETRISDSVLDEVVGRSHDNLKSGEDDNPMATQPRPEDNPDAGPPPPRKIVQHYPFWNYWTYKKQLYQDVCPAGQAKIADRCIWLPPH